MTRARSPEHLISVAEAAEYLSVHHLTVRRWISQGKLTGYRLASKRIRLDRGEVEALVRRIPTVRSAG